ncbi:hypothetical protein V5799_014730 [Amblyomma americanum]|uniref:Uncharacterized protein n=1 Tax=Amblyomma americanum TaxID=6943 RepID=A0AAQ4E268_AMBAM
MLSDDHILTGLSCTPRSFTHPIYCVSHRRLQLPLSSGVLLSAAQGGAIAIVVLYVLMVRYLTDEWYAHGSFLVAFTYALNDLLIIIASLSSPSTQMHIPRTVFVSRESFATCTQIVDGITSRTPHLATPRQITCPMTAVVGHVIELNRNNLSPPTRA